MKKGKVEMPLYKVSFSRQIAIGIASVAIAALVWVMVETTGWTNDFQQWLFGSSTSMGELHQQYQTSYYESVKRLLTLFFFYLLMFLMPYAGLFLLLSLILFFFTSRFRHPVVFISYKYHSTGNKTGTYEIAKEIEKVLDKNGFRVQMQDFEPQPIHDHLNHKIKNMLRKSDAMIVVPDPVHPSYVNAEIFAAFYANKPLYLVKHRDDQRLPDTANSGHTVLQLKKLRKKKYKPLMHLLNYTHRHWTSQGYLFSVPLEIFLMPAAELDDNDRFWQIVIICGVVLAAFIFLNTPINMVLAIIKLLLIFLGIVAAYKIIKALLINMKVRDIVRQEVLDAQPTRAHFQLAHIDKSMLECMDELDA